MFIIIDGIICETLEHPIMLILTKRDKQQIQANESGVFASWNIRVKANFNNKIYNNGNPDLVALVFLSSYDIGLIGDMNEDCSRYCAFPDHDPARPKHLISDPARLEDYLQEIKSFMSSPTEISSTNSLSLR